MGRRHWIGAAVGLVVAAWAVVPAADAKRPQHKPRPKEHTFRVTWTISGGTWTSDYNCRCDHDSYGGIHTAGESDNHLQIEASFADLKLPLHGTPSIHLKASAWSASGRFSMFEDVWLETNHDYPIACNGSLEKGGEAPTLSTTSATSSTELHVSVESGTLKVGPVSGTNCHGLGKWQPFWPVSSLAPDSGSPQAYVERMLGVRVAELLSALRSMKVGDVDGATLHARTGLPPASCDFFSGDTATCTEALHWTGHIKFERTG